MTGDVVALKQVKWAVDQSFRDGFITALREINVLLALRHPNIVRAREMVVGARADEVFMVMDYYEHDLRTLLTRGGRRSARHPFSHAEIKGLFVNFFMQQLIFLRWFLHRDLKTSNLVEQSSVLAVCDFGLARRYGSRFGVHGSRRDPLVSGAGATLGPPPDGCYRLRSIVGARVHPRGCSRGASLCGPRNEIEQVRKIFATLGSPTVRRGLDTQICPGQDALVSPLTPPEACSAGEGAGAIFPRRATRGWGALSSRAQTFSRGSAYDPERRMSARRLCGIGSRSPRFRTRRTDANISSHKCWCMTSRRSGAKQLSKLSD